MPEKHLYNLIFLKDCYSPKSSDANPAQVLFSYLGPFFSKQLQNTESANSMWYLTHIESLKCQNKIHAHETQQKRIIFSKLYNLSLSFFSLQANNKKFKFCVLLPVNCFTSSSEEWAHYMQWYERPSCWFHEIMVWLFELQSRAE